MDEELTFNFYTYSYTPQGIHKAQAPLTMFPGQSCLVHHLEDHPRSVPVSEHGQHGEPRKILQSWCELPLGRHERVTLATLSRYQKLEVLVMPRD